MKQSVFQKRLQVLREKITNIKADTIWVVQPENRRYLSGFRAVDTQLNESSGSLVINQSHAILVTDSRYTTEAEKEARDFEVVTIKKELTEDLPELLSRINTKVLGFEGDFLSWKLHGQLKKVLKALSPPVALTPLKGLVEAMREVKDRSEIRAMASSAAMMAKILDEVIPKLKPGRTEKEIAWEIECLAHDAGADGLAFPSIVASGPNGALPHATPTNRKIRSKESIIFDVGVRLNGYCCDMTRTIFLETPGPKFKTIYQTVREAQLAALDKVKPGVQSTQLDSTARDIIRDAGFGDYFGHSLGHGVGLATHEDPRIMSKKSKRLDKGMVCTIEPGIYIPGKGGVRLEEMVVIEQGGPRILTEAAGYFYDFR